ncbi:MAG: oligosaccharide flippase family protein [Bacteroidales bacterium]|nr:oligosaccharide flippase family protein [Bacteroidales bacterium]
MKRNFVTNLAFLLFLNLLIKPFYVLGIDVSIQNAVTASVYGIYFPLLSLSLMFQVILDMGIESFTRREIAQNHHLLSRYLSNIIVLKLFLALIYFIVCLIIGILSNYNPYQIKLLFILLINQFLASFILYMRANLGGLHLFKTESVISVLDKTLLIIICGLLLWGNITDVPFKIEWFIFAQTFSYSVTLIISLIILTGKEKVSFSRFNVKIYFSIIKKSLPFALLVLLMSSYYRIDSILLERMAENGDVQAGIYAHSFRLLDMLQNYGYLLPFCSFPCLQKCLKNKESVEQLVHISSVIIVIPALILSVGAVFYKMDIIDFLYDEHLEKSSTVFGIIMPGFLGICISYIFGTLLTANGNLKSLITISAIGATISIFINLVLIPKIGVTGSAIANISAQAFTALVQIIVAIRIFKFRFNVKLVVKLLIYSLLLIITAYITHKFKLNWLLNFSIYALISFFLIFMVRLIKIYQLKEIIGKRKMNYKQHLSKSFLIDF